MWGVKKAAEQLIHEIFHTQFIFHPVFFFFLSHSRFVKGCLFQGNTARNRRRCLETHSHTRNMFFNYCSVERYNCFFCYVTCLFSGTSGMYVRNTKPGPFETEGHILFFFLFFFFLNRFTQLEHFGWKNVGLFQTDQESVSFHPLGCWGLFQ